MRPWFLIPLAFLASACGLVDPGGWRERDVYERELARWRAEGIHSYSFEMQKGCFCPPEEMVRVRVEVVADSIVAVHGVAGDTLIPRNPDYGYAAYQTVEGLFGVIEHALENDHEITVRYDRELHYPREINIDIPNTQDGGARISADGLQARSDPAVALRSD